MSEDVTGVERPHEPLPPHAEIIVPRVPFWQDWRWAMSVSLALALLATVIFGVIGYESKQDDRAAIAELKLGRDRDRFENTCRSRRAANLTLPQAEEFAATGRALLIGLAGDRPEVADLVDRYVKDAAGKTTDEAFLEQVRKLLIAANEVDASIEQRREAENACAALALERYPGS